MSETSPGANFTNTNSGWTVGSTAAGNDSAADANTLATTFVAVNTHPDGSINTGSLVGDCWRSAVPLTGTFATGNWTFQGSVIRAAGGAGGAGKCKFRLHTAASQDGSSATQITTGQLAGNIVTLSTISQTDSIYTGSITTFNVSNEYLFIEVGWEITTAASGHGVGTAGVLWRLGDTASQIITSDFTTTAGQSDTLEAGTMASVSSGAGQIAWTSPELGSTEDTSFAVYSSTASVFDEESENLRATNFGFAIPTGATIDSIVADINRKSDTSGGINTQSVLHSPDQSRS